MRRREVIRRPSSPRWTPSLQGLECRTLLSTIYVDAAAPGPTHSGTSWGSAYADLQQALAAAVSGDSIHVAGGTYKPTTTTDKTISFQLKSGVGIYGGYAGYTSAQPDARDVAAYPTILSGDIGAAGNNSVNSYHVVVGSGTDSTAILDGVTVTAGAADGTSGDQLEGGGILNHSGSPTINDCIITGNLSGGGIANLYSSPILTNCLITENYSSGGGGGITNNFSSSPILTDCTISGNFAADGGGMDTFASCSPVLVRCRFEANQGGGLFVYASSTATLTDCSFIRNT